MKYLLIMLMLIPALASAQYWATPSGAGAHTGLDVANAWSFSEAMNADAGDTVSFKAGTYPYIFSPNNSGSAGLPIVFKAADGETVTFTGVSDGDVNVISLWADYIELHGVHITTAEETAGDGDYIVSWNGSHNVLRNCTLAKGGDILDAYFNSVWRARGIAVSGTYQTIDSNVIRGMNEGIVLAGDAPRYYTIRGNTITASVWNGIICGASTGGSTAFHGVLIEGNVIDTSYGEDNIQWQQNWDGSPNVLRNRGYIVRNNRLGKAEENSMDFKGASYVIVEGNLIYTTDGNDDGEVDEEADFGSGPAVERGNPENLNEYFVTFRGNVVWDGAGGITMSHASNVINNVFANNRRRLTVSNYSDSTESGMRHVNIEGSDTYPRSILNNAFVGQPNYANLYFWNMDNRTSILTIDHNLYWDSTTSAHFFHRKSSGTSTKVWGIAAWKTALANSDYSYMIGKEQHSLEVDPEFEDFPLRPYNYNPAWDWSLASGSPGIDAGRCWTFANGGGAGSASLVVDNPYVFTDGYGITTGDSIYVSGEAVRITSINYTTSTLTLSRVIDWADNDSVYFYTSGSIVNDIGTFTAASGGGITDPQGPPDVPTNYAPANGSTTTTPVTFRWSRPAGAESFWLSVSDDNWATLIISNNALTDTFYTTSLTMGKNYVWNVAAINTYGQSSWSEDWSFYVSVVVGATRDTVDISWNTVSHTFTLDTLTQFAFTDLQRRDAFVSVRNPLGKEAHWTDVTWLTSAPPAILPANTWFIFFRTSGDTILGAYMNAVPSFTATWGNISGVLANQADLIALLAQYAKKTEDLILTGAQESRSIMLVETDAPDTVKMRINSGVLEFYDLTNGWKSLGDLVGGGGSDGQDADSIQGVPVQSTRPADSLSSLVYDPATGVYKHVRTSTLDSTVAALSDSTAHVLTYHHGQLVLATRPAGGSGISAATAASMISDSVVARSNDYATPTHTHTGVYQPAGTYLVPSDTSLHLKRTDTTWVVYRSRADASYQAKGTYLVPADTNLHMKRTDTTWIMYRSKSDALYQAKATYLVPADTNLRLRRTDTTWIVYRSRADNSYQAKGSYAATSDSNSWLATWADINAKNYLTAETGDISNVGVTAPITGGGSSGSVTIGWDSTALNYTKLLRSRADSTVILLPILDSTWMAANGTSRHLPVMLMHKWFTVDSMMVAVLGTASTDTVAVDVRWSNDYSTGSGGTALQTTPTNCPASTTGTRVGSFTNVNIPKFHWIWMRLTKKVGTPKSVSVTLKGRWQ